MNSSDSAEEFVKICLDGIDHAIRIMGVGAKKIGAMLIALSKEKKQTKGKTRLTNMLKTGKPLQIFTIKAEDLKKFSQEAKKYGILYCALANKKNSKIDGMVDILVRDEDSPKINRIADRFNFRSVASVKKDLENEKQEKQNNLKVDEKIKTEEEKFIDDVMPKDMEKSINSPSKDTKDTEEKNLLEPSLNTKLKDKVKNSEVDKKSVREELKNIENELKEKEFKHEKQKFEFNLLKNKRKNKKQDLIKENNEIKKGKHFKPPRHLDNSKRKKKRRRKERSL